MWTSTGTLPWTGLARPLRTPWAQWRRRRGLTVRAGRALTIPRFGAGHDARIAPENVILDQRLEVVLEFFGPTSTLESITKQKLYAFVTALEARKGRDGGPLNAKPVNRS